MKKPEHEYYNIDDIAEIWNFKTTDLMELCRQKKLKIVINWKKLRKANGNTSCIHKDVWMKVNISEDVPAKFPSTPCSNCLYRNDQTTCKFDFSEELLQEQTEEELKWLDYISIEKRDYLISNQERKRFESEQDIDSEKIDSRVSEKRPHNKESLKPGESEQLGERAEKTYLKILGALLTIHYSKAPFKKPAGLNANQIAADIVSNLSKNDMNDFGISEGTIRKKIGTALKAINENKI